MRRTLLIAAACGAAAFLAADAIAIAAKIGGERPWFIAALPSALLTAAFVAATGAVVSYWRRAAQFVDAYLLAVVLAAGAAVPMTVTLFAHPEGPGSLFPLAIALGAIVLAVASLIGTSLGWLLRRARR